ncbi:hypothetical protein Lgra_2590 [Legionella gratiana]|uniref:Uncharacterized protein n=1 Tax=Legionella gratiana TaxID=45066 RepID=A0A378J4G6_9GAMM|nr:YaaC family protein [Legionella gratiana]KTD05813.1 hypothetical protein Lgra_2590 [Legionella gratiana]STX42148.1 Uncharacterised protein [Legionella gratiana]
MRDVWSRLLNFQSHDLIKKLYKIKHNRTLNANKIKQISSNFIQAREYFRNYEQASYSVQPLLLYYGILSLSRGLILFLGDGITEAAMKQGHGLNTIQWSEILSNGLKSIEKLEVKTCGGTFLELIEATTNKSYLRHNSSGVNNHQQYSSPSVGQILNLDGLLRTVPDLMEEYSGWRGTPPLLFPISELKDEGAELNIKIPNRKYITEENLMKLFGHNARITSPDQKNNYFTVSTSNKNLYLTQKFIDNFHIGQVFIGQGVTKEANLSVLCTFFCLSYYLGMLCRYFPSIWLSSEQTTQGDSVYPLIKKSLSLMFNYYPILINDFLNTEPYEFEI